MPSLPFKIKHFFVSHSYCTRVALALLVLHSCCACVARVAVSAYCPRGTDQDHWAAAR